MASALQRDVDSSGKLAFLKLSDRSVAAGQLKSNRQPPEKVGLYLGEDGHYRLTTEVKSFPVRAELRPNGQLVWTSTAPISKTHVRKIVEAASVNNQSLHVNTGTHGDKNGYTTLQNDEYGEAAFFAEDFATLSKFDNTSLHIVSSESGAIYPDRADWVIDAWCFSHKSADKVKHIAKGLFLIMTCPNCNSQTERKIADRGDHNIIRKKIEFLKEGHLCGCSSSLERSVTVVVRQCKHIVEFQQEGSAPQIKKAGPADCTYPLSEAYQYYQIKL